MKVLLFYWNVLSRIVLYPKCLYEVTLHSFLSVCSFVCKATEKNISMIPLYFASMDMATFHVLYNTFAYANIKIY